jgi:hypothetical protein
MADYDAKWFRSWHGAPTDPKWLVIARKAQVAPGVVSAVFWALMDYASQHTDRGSVDGFDVETYAAFTGWEESEIIAVLAAMTNKGTITPDNRLAAWDKRQPKKEDPTATERQQRKRERDKLTERDNGVTNAPVTPSNSDVTPRHAMSRDVTTDKIREDKIREDEKRTNDARTPDFPPGFDEFERIFKGNLLTTLQERDPGQRFHNGFSLADTSKAALLQLMSGGPILSSKAIDWALDQWEQAKPNERFEAKNTGCVNWLLATIKNGYTPGKKKESTNGKSTAFGFSGVAADAPRKPTAAEIAEWERDFAAIEDNAARPAHLS